MLAVCIWGLNSIFCVYKPSSCGWFCSNNTRGKVKHYKNPRERHVMCGDWTWPTWSSVFHAFILMVQSYNAAEVGMCRASITYTVGNLNSMYVLLYFPPMSYIVYYWGFLSFLIAECYKYQKSKYWRNVISHLQCQHSCLYSMFSKNVYIPLYPGWV